MDAMALVGRNLTSFGIGPLRENFPPLSMAVIDSTAYIGFVLSGMCGMGYVLLGLGRVCIVDRCQKIHR